jgi:hypothetical protein
MKKSIIFIGLILGVVIINNFAQAQVEQGFLEGKVTIGPICSVEIEEVPCEIPPEVYEERKIVIYTQDKESMLAVVNIDGDGNYRAALDPGIYVVDINYTGADFSKDVPREIEIKPGETVRLDISIDTGVRGGEGLQSPRKERLQFIIERIAIGLTVGVLILFFLVLFIIWKIIRH